jgi:hypothetical protein
MNLKYIVFVCYEDTDYDCYYGKAKGGMLIEEATRGGYLYRFELEEDMIAFLTEQREHVQLI